MLQRNQPNVVDIASTLESLTDYYVLINGVAFDDADGNDYGGISAAVWGWAAESWLNCCR